MITVGTLQSGISYADAMCTIFQYRLSLHWLEGVLFHAVEFVLDLILMAHEPHSSPPMKSVSVSTVHHCYKIQF